MMVPAVPSPATKWVTSGQSRQISGPVPSWWAFGLAGLPYWTENHHSGCSSARACARRMAPLDPSAAGETIMSAPKARNNLVRSTETFSGTTAVNG